MCQQKNEKQKNRPASLTLCGQREHLIRGGMNSAFHSWNKSYRKAWRRERQARQVPVLTLLEQNTQ